MLLEVRKAWLDWLAFVRWDLFLTLTLSTGYEPHPETLDKAFVRFYRKLCRVCESPCVVVRAWEYQRRGISHFHCLVYFVNPFFFVDYRRIDRIWDRGNVDIEVPRNFGAVAGYLSKYVFKGGRLDVYGRRRDVRMLLRLGKRAYESRTGATRVVSGKKRKSS